MTPPAGEGRTALVTGASSGIGAAFAAEFARHGFSLVLTARRTQRLETQARALAARFGVKTRIMAADLADPTAPDRIFDMLESEAIVIDALINNAGYGVSGRFDEVALPIHRDFLEVLLRAPCALAHRALPGMRARGYGRIVNVASLAGFAPATIGSTLYPAAKRFLIAFSQSLALEAEGSGIHVTAVCPGFTHTEFHDGADLRADIARVPQFLWMSAETVACQGYQAVMAGRPLVVNGRLNQLAAALLTHLPNGPALALMRRIMRP